MRLKELTRKLTVSGAIVCALGAATVGLAPTVAASSMLKKGLKVFVIPKNLGNSYFTTADSVRAAGRRPP